MRSNVMLIAQAVVQAQLSILTAEERLTVLLSLTAREICTLPVSQRDGALQTVLSELPGIVGATEAGMRMALVENPRRGI